MRVVMVSKALLVGAYQRKLEEIARLDIELLTLVPPSWKDERGETKNGESAREPEPFHSALPFKPTPICFDDAQRKSPDSLAEEHPRRRTVSRRCHSVSRLKPRSGQAEQRYCD